MEWGQFFATAGVPTRDKGAFFALLAIGLVLSLLKLKEIKGPPDLEFILFEPISRLIGG